MSQYEVWEVQYAKNTRMFFYILSHFAVCFSGCSDPQSFAHEKIRHICQHKLKSNILIYLGFWFLDRKMFFHVICFFIRGCDTIKNPILKSELMDYNTFWRV